MPLAPEYQALLAELAENPGPAFTELSPDEGRAMYRLMRPVNEELPIGSVRRSTDPAPAAAISRSASTPQRETAHFRHSGEFPRWRLGHRRSGHRRCGLPRMCRLGLRGGFGGLPTGAGTSLPAPWRLLRGDLLGSREHEPTRRSTASSAWVAKARVAIWRRGVPKRATKRARTSTSNCWPIPVTDHDLTRQSYQDNGEGYLLETDNHELVLGPLLPGTSRRAKPAPPVLAESFNDLPPALVVTAEFDPLRDEGRPTLRHCSCRRTAPKTSASTGWCTIFWPRARSSMLQPAAFDRLQACEARRWPDATLRRIDALRAHLRRQTGQPGPAAGQPGKPPGLRRHQKSAIRLAGPMLSDDGEGMVGSLFIIEADSAEDVKRPEREDPYTLAGLLAASRPIRPFRQVLPHPSGSEPGLRRGRQSLDRLPMIRCGSVDPGFCVTRQHGRHPDSWFHREPGDAPSTDSTVAVPVSVSPGQTWLVKRTPYLLRRPSPT